ncbi:hypothetical protein KHQ81_15775 (plasmid) [Mycoplasmatota bacterium]|nr:hypothetical protein KHQ81_15775 [Mycoplasmatota bacterium]
MDYNTNDGRVGYKGLGKPCSLTEVRNGALDDMLDYEINSYRLELDKYLENKKAHPGTTAIENDKSKNCEYNRLHRQVSLALDM